MVIQNDGECGGYPKGGRIGGGPGRDTAVLEDVRDDGVIATQLLIDGVRGSN